MKTHAILTSIILLASPQILRAQPAAPAVDSPFILSTKLTESATAYFFQPPASITQAYNEYARKKKTRDELKARYELIQSVEDKVRQNAYDNAQRTKPANTATVAIRSDADADADKLDDMTPLEQLNHYRKKMGKTPLTEAEFKQFEKMSEEEGISFLMKKDKVQLTDAQLKKIHEEDDKEEAKMDEERFKTMVCESRHQDLGNMISPFRPTVYIAVNQLESIGPGDPGYDLVKDLQAATEKLQPLVDKAIADVKQHENVSELGVECSVNPYGPTLAAIRKHYLQRYIREYESDLAKLQTEWKKMLTNAKAGYLSDVDKALARLQTQEPTNATPDFSYCYISVLTFDEVIFSYYEKGYELYKAYAELEKNIREQKQKSKWVPKDCKCSW